MKILVTGVAGFIGFHTAKKFLDRGDQVIGIDSINNYYDQNLKKSRLKLLRKYKTKFIFIKFNIANKKKLESCFNKHKFERVVHLAAQAGVRYSIENPSPYIYSNVVGFGNILEDADDTRLKIYFLQAVALSMEVILVSLLRKWTLLITQ